MIYEISWNSKDLIYIIFIVIIIVIYIILKMIKNNLRDDNAQNALIKLCLLFMMGICILSIVFGMSRKMYKIHVYHSGNYEMIEGEIKNLEFIYENNTNNIKKIKFTINEINFRINEEILNSGYSYINDKKIKNNDYLRIYYIRQNENEIILRMDDIKDGAN